VQDERTADSESVRHETHSPGGHENTPKIRPVRNFMFSSSSMHACNICKFCMC